MTSRHPSLGKKSESRRSTVSHTHTIRKCLHCGAYFYCYNKFSKDRSIFI